MVKLSKFMEKIDMERQYEQKEYIFLCSVCLENKIGNYFSGTCKDCLKKQTIKGDELAKK